MPTFTQIASDNFARANENPLNPANWILQSGYSVLQVVSDVCIPTTNAGSMEVFSGAVFGANQYSTITIGVGLSTSNWAPVICGSVSVNNQYFALVSGPLTSAATIQLFKKVAGTATQLGSTVTGLVSTGDTITLYALNGTIVVLHNGTQIISASDSSILNGLPGAFCSDGASVNNVSITSWSGGLVNQSGPSFASPPLNGAVLAADSFLRPNVSGSTNYNGNWLQPNSSDHVVAIQGNAMVPGTGGAANAAIYVNVTTNPSSTTGGLPSGAMFAADQWCSAQLYSAGAADVYGLILRSDQGNASPTYYLFFGVGIGAGSVTVKIRKLVAGVLTDLATTTTATVNQGSQFVFSVQGTTLTGYIDGVQVLQTTDSAITSGSPGFYLNGAVNTVALSMWRGGVFNLTGSTVVFIGDSIISRWNLAQQFPGKSYCNCGIGSQTSTQILSRFNLEVIGQLPTVVVIEGGRNGFQAGTETVAQTTANMAAMGAAAAAAKIKIVYTDTIASGNSGDIPTLGADIDALNLNVDGFTNGVVSNWNLAIDFQTSPTTVNPANYIADLIHPNTTGYALLAPVASASIAQAIGGKSGSMDMAYDFAF